MSPCQCCGDRLRFGHAIKHGILVCVDCRELPESTLKAMVRSRRTMLDALAWQPM